MVCWRWRLLAGVGVLALGRVAAPQAPPDVEPPIPGLIVPLPSPVSSAESLLPIVNDGFANDEDIQGSIKPLVDALRSSIFADRQNASQALLRLPPARLEDVVDALAVETDPEAIERLTEAAAHLFLKPRTYLRTKASLFGVWFEQPSLSMLGVKFKMDPVKLKPDDASPTMTVMVTEIQVGFPAMQTLRNGDRVVAIGGIGFPSNVPFDDTDYFRSRVAKLWPGGVASMTILRDGRLLEMGVQITGLPLNGPSSPTSMVEARTIALDAFLESLKTGDSNQARALTPVEAPRIILLNPYSQ